MVVLPYSEWQATQFNISQVYLQHIYPIVGFRMNIAHVDDTLSSLYRISHCGIYFLHARFKRSVRKDLKMLEYLLFLRIHHHPSFWSFISWMLQPHLLYYALSRHRGLIAFLLSSALTLQSYPKLSVLP